MQKTNTKSIKALICQIKPEYKNKASNIKRIRQHLNQYSKDNKFDIIMFPEMAFIGYNFKDHKDIIDYTEQCGKGQSFIFCQDLAKRLNSYVLYGYAEKQEQKQNSNIFNLFNSACLIDRNGNILVNTRKTHMYESDQLWCKQGSGFKTATIFNNNNQSFKCAIGICMDINPKGFKSRKHQLADFILESQSDILLFVSAWNDHQPNQPNQNQSQLGIINYWIDRLEPILETPQEDRRQLLIFVCDRTGEELTYTKKQSQKTQFIGTSCAIRLNPCQLIQKSGKKNEQYLIVNTWIKNQQLKTK